MKPNAINCYNIVQLCLQGLIALVLILSATGTVTVTTLVIVIALSQGLAVIEVWSAARGNTGSTFAASLIQVGARIAVSVLLFFFLPVGPQWMIVLLGVAWVGADTLRYLYYLEKANRLLAWARYSGFIVLYPMGMTLENMIVWRLMQHFLDQPLWFFVPFLSIYLVFAVKMYLHMLRQRLRFLTRLKRPNI
jgi:very-long-chain (3R)-3-hydroxyacyl-CoA dehydratase